MLFRRLLAPTVNDVQDDDGHQSSGTDKLIQMNQFHNLYLLMMVLRGLLLSLRLLMRLLFLLQIYEQVSKSENISHIYFVKLTIKREESRIAFGLSRA
jgi:hypothetical protein